MERRLFEDLVDSDRVRHGTSQSLTVPVSAALHIVAVILLLVVPLLSSEELRFPPTARAFSFRQTAACTSTQPTCRLSFA